MEEQRKYSILFAATTLAARKLHEIGDKPCPARECAIADAIVLRAGGSAEQHCDPLLWRNQKQGRPHSGAHRRMPFPCDRSAQREAARRFSLHSKRGSCPGLPRNLGHAHKESGIAGPAPARFSAVIREEGHCHRGVPQKTARELGGCKTDAVFSRYNIVSEADIRDATKKNRSRSQGRNAQFIQSCATRSPACRKWAWPHG